METAHRKIALQSPADLAYLEATARRAARRKIDQNLPASAAPTGEDALRRKVEELVEEYIRTTFSLARPNLSVNGIDLDGNDAAATAAGGAPSDARQQPAAADDASFEPYDTRLAERIRALEASKEALTERVADQRRGAPQAAAARFAEGFATEVARDEEGGEAAAAAAVGVVKEEEDGQGVGGTEEGGLLGVKGEDLRRWDEVRRTWERGTEGLVGLVDGLGEAVGRLERAKEVVAALEGK
ncbi:hypothetical protein BDY21DRAFT_396889 [Lineolata rhizophorae]|uniref:Kinetochore protein mis14 n=1 Tax=Lineolata rhizophorae TaxID=578093 RepID=A0A6A6NUF5_9PEZI|nr:hypothetical protein BDY21DRAFT_396889 [Lineolata rhizophorae]